MGHRGGAATKQTAPRRRNPKGGPSHYSDRLLAILALPACALALAAADAPRPELVRVRVAVAPEDVPAGGRFVARFELTPEPGIKLTRYPKIKVEVPEQEGLAGGASIAVGNDGPPPPDGDPEANYFERLDPVELALDVHPEAARGRLTIAARLSYAYCVLASGYCAPIRSRVEIPITVR